MLVSFSKEVLEQMLNLEPGVAETQVIIVIIDNIWRPRWTSLSQSSSLSTLEAFHHSLLQRTLPTGWEVKLSSKALSRWPTG